jgi:hypothetical protein
MVQRLKKILIVPVASLGLAGLFGLAVMAQDSADELTSTQIESIRSNCVVSQASLQRLRDSDLIARTIHGRTYNDLSVLIRSFNARVVSNGINTPDLIAVPNSLDSVYRNFYNQYTTYATSLREALNIDCRNNPERFYAQFLQLEQDRERLATYVSDMQKLLSDYRGDVVELRTQLKASEERGSR